MIGLLTSRKMMTRGSIVIEKLLRRFGLPTAEDVTVLKTANDELRAALDAAWVEADRERARRAQVEDQRMVPAPSYTASESQVLAKERLDAVRERSYSYAA